MLFKSIAVAAALSIGTLAAASAQAGHRHHRHHGHTAAVGVFGFAAGTMVGAALAQPRPAPRVVYTSDWVAYCSAKYNSYNPATNLYLGFDGFYHQCR